MKESKSGNFGSFLFFVSFLFVIGPTDSEVLSSEKKTNGKAKLVTWPAKCCIKLHVVAGSIKMKRMMVWLLPSKSSQTVESAANIGNCCTTLWDSIVGRVAAFGSVNLRVLNSYPSASTFFWEKLQFQIDFSENRWILCTSTQMTVAWMTVFIWPKGKLTLQSFKLQLYTWL